MRRRNPTLSSGVTGGIAVYKACELLRLLQKRGIDVFVVMTQNACRFVAPLTFETLSGHPVAVDTFDRPQTWEVEHIALAKRADLFMIAPATADIIGKMACGIADDMLSTTVMATRAPVLIAPAMNTGMWENAAVQQNVKTLQVRGVEFVMPWFPAIGLRRQRRRARWKTLRSSLSTRAKCFLQKKI